MKAPMAKVFLFIFVTNLWYSSAGWAAEALPQNREGPEKAAGPGLGQGMGGVNLGLETPEEDEKIKAEFELAKEYIDQQEWKKAFDTLQNLINDGYKRTYYWTGVVHYKMGKYETAKGYFRKATEYPETKVNARIFLGHLYENGLIDPGPVPDNEEYPTLRKAWYHYAVAAKSGRPIAKLHAARAFDAYKTPTSNGKEATRIRKEINDFYHELIKLGPKEIIAVAYCALGERYYHTQGVSPRQEETNKVAALGYFRKATALFKEGMDRSKLLLIDPDMYHAKSLYYLGRLHLDLPLPHHSEEWARHYLTQALEVGKLSETDRTEAEALLKNLEPGLKEAAN